MTLLDLPLAHNTRPLLQTLLEQLALAAPTETGQLATSVPLTDLDDKEYMYARAMYDVLHLLGAIEEDDEGVRPASIQAGYLLRLLVELSQIGAPLVADWTHEGLSRNPSHPFGRAVDLLKVLELRRLELHPGARPLRLLTAAMGVVVRHGDTEPDYLLSWDDGAHAWQLLGGRNQLEDQSPRGTLLRELAEELECAPLHEGVHVQLSDLGSLVGRERLSPTYGLNTITTFHFYAVRFLNHELVLHHNLRWVSEHELLAGVTDDHKKISVEPLLLLRDQLGHDMVELLLG